MVSNAQNRLIVLGGMLGDMAQTYSFSPRTSANIQTTSSQMSNQPNIVLTNGDTTQTATIAQMAISNGGDGSGGANNGVAVNGALGIGGARGYGSSTAQSATPGYNLAVTVKTIFAAVADQLSPAAALTALKPFTTFSVAEAAPRSPSVSDKADAANALALCVMVRVLALIAYAQAVAAVTYTTRSAAIQRRADLVESFNQLIEDIGNSVVDAPVVAADARDMTVIALTNQITTLKPLVIVSSSAPLPVLYWAHRLYGSAKGKEDIAANCDDLITLNGAADPGIMPVQFQAKAP